MTPAELLLQDWGRPASLRRINSTYDPTTGLLLEDPQDTPLRVIPGPSEEVCQPATRALAAQQSQTFLVATTDLPATADLLACHLLYDDQQYSISRIETSPVPLLSILHCRSLS